MDWLAIAWLWWSRPTKAQPAIARSSMARSRSTKQKRGRHSPPALSRKPRRTNLKAQAKDRVFSSVPTGLGDFSSINQSIFLFVFITCFKGFFINWSLIWFSSSVSRHWVRMLFTSDMIIFETHQLPYGARMFLLVSWFSSPVSQWVGRFFITLHSYLYLHPHVQWCSRLRGKAIVMSWSRDLQVTGCTWSSHASTLSSSPPLWALLCTASLSLQSYHHTYGTLPPDRLEIKVALMSVDQTDMACRSNVGQDFGGIQSMSMVTTQSFADCERAVECHLTYLVFCIAKESSSVIWPNWCFA